MLRIVLFNQPSFQVPGRERCESGTPFGIKIARLLGYKGLAFENDEVGWLERMERLPRLSKSNKLPVLEYDGERTAMKVSFLKPPNGGIIGLEMITFVEPLGLECVADGSAVQAALDAIVSDVLAAL